MEEAFDHSAIENSEFIYTATLKLSEMPFCRAKGTFPGVTDLAVNSRSFKSYVECVESAKALMQDIVKDANYESESELTVSAEVNASFTGFEPKSKGWTSTELARIWIITKAEEGTPILHALGQARIFACEKSDQEVLVN